MIDASTFIYDDFAWKLAERLLEDFEPFCPEGSLNAAKAACAARNVEDLRALTFGQERLSPFLFKIFRQVLDLFKKYSFDNDLYTPTQLRDLSIEKFMENQERLSNFTLNIDSPELRRIVFSARGYVDQVLGYFDPLEIMSRATFGKKSSVGIPMRMACEGQRYEAPITGSLEHISWFDRYYSAYNRPAYLYAKMRAELSNKPLYRDVSKVEAVLVDKTWKSLRMIVPNTTIGTLYSGGLGVLLEDRLRSYGYDIKRLQPVHGELAKFGSLTGSLVTADQSMASDNITCQLVDRLFPRPWAHALQFGRIGGLGLYGKDVVTPTFSTMGIGFTFPLQTLIFLCLLLAIRDECGLDESAVVSVYGDDLIYDREMHDCVMRTFPALGLVINADKTFAEGDFRESCGYDYYRGVDVRPFHLGRSIGLTARKRRAEAYLYKAFNGLLRRWEPLDIPATFRFVVGEIRRIRGSEPLTVPTDYPDTSGCKVNSSQAAFCGVDIQRRRDIHGTYKFRYLAFEPELRSEDRHEPYLFRTLASKSVLAKIPFVRRGSGDVLEDSPSMLKWMDHLEGGSVRSFGTGRRLRRQQSFIPQQDKGRYRERPGITCNWTPEATKG